MWMMETTGGVSVGTRDHRSHHQALVGVWSAGLGMGYISPLHLSREVLQDASRGCGKGMCRVDRYRQDMETRLSNWSLNSSWAVDQHLPTWRTFKQPLISQVLPHLSCCHKGVFVVMLFISVPIQKQVWVLHPCISLIPLTLKQIHRWNTLM